VPSGKCASLAPQQRCWGARQLRRPAERAGESWIGVPMVFQGRAFDAKRWRVIDAEPVLSKELQGGSQMDGRVFEGAELRRIHRPGR